LNHCIIQGRQFKDVIMDDSTEILGQDWKYQACILTSAIL
jgi:hypothetical protein